MKNKYSLIVEGRDMLHFLRKHWSNFFLFPKHYGYSHDLGSWPVNCFHSHERLFSKHLGKLFHTFLASVFYSLNKYLLNYSHSVLLLFSEDKTIHEKVTSMVPKQQGNVMY